MSEKEADIQVVQMFEMLGCICLRNLTTGTDSNVLTTQLLTGQCVGESESQELSK